MWDVLRATDLVEIEHQVQLAHVVEVLVEHLDEVVYRLQVVQIVVLHVDADAEVQAGVASVDDLEVAELERSGGDERVNQPRRNSCASRRAR